MYNRDDKQMKNVAKKKINNAKDEEHKMHPKPNSEGKGWKEESYPAKGPVRKAKEKATPNPHTPNKKDRYPDWNEKPKDDGGTKVPKKPAPKSPMSPAAKKLKRTASRTK
jgi:hypothetical protein